MSVSSSREKREEQKKVTTHIHAHTLACPQCGSRKTYRDGLRYTSEGPVQRYLCRECGFRFSESQVSYDLSDKGTDRQVCATFQEAKNLNQTTAQRAVVGEKPQIRAKIIEFGFHLQKAGYAEGTVRTYMRNYRCLINLGADLTDPESVKEVVARQNWRNSTKQCYCIGYETFLRYLGLRWERPRYVANPRVPFVPLETELDILIHGTRRKLSVLLQTLKETGCRIGEALRLRWLDIDAERNIIRINDAEKGSINRSIRVSANMIQRLQALVKKSEYVFPLHREGITSRYGFVRKRLAQEHGNPRLLSISFHTFRHWFGTTQYHKTKDILYVKQLLGHKRIENTLIYISLEQSLYGMNENAEFHVKAATTLEEACELLKQGFDFITDMDGSKLFRKRQ